MDAHNGIGSGAEAILPIDKLPVILGLDKLYEQAQTPVNTTAVFNIDGKEFMRAVAKHQDIFDDYKNTRNTRLAY